MVEQKTKISAKEVVIAVRNGVSNAELMLKYGLSHDGLQEVFDKLIAAGLLRKAELNSRKIPLDDDLDLEWEVDSDADIPPEAPEETPIPSGQKRADPTTFKCPACNMPQTREFKTCPQCGVLVDKYVKKKADEKKIATERQEASSKRKYAILIGVVSFLVVGLAIGYLYKKRGSEYQSESPAVGPSREVTSALTYKNLSNGLVDDLELVKTDNPQDEEHKFIVGKNETKGIGLAFFGTPAKVDKIELSFEPDKESEAKLELNLNYIAKLLKGTVPKQFLKESAKWVEIALSKIDPNRRDDNQFDSKEFDPVRITLWYIGSRETYLLTVDLPTEFGDSPKCRGMVRGVLKNRSPQEIVDISFNQVVTDGCIGEASEFLRSKLVNINRLAIPEPTIHLLCRNAHTVPNFLTSLEFMLKNGANPNIRNRDGKTPLEELTWHHQQSPSDLTFQGIALLKKYGGR